VSVVVLSWNTRELLARCLDSLRAQGQELPLEVIVVDNASADGSAEMVAHDFPEVVLLRNGRNEGYAIGNNQGAARARAGAPAPAQLGHRGAAGRDRHRSRASSTRIPGTAPAPRGSSARTARPSARARPFPRC
jgi:hypothetical protein